MKEDITKASLAVLLVLALIISVLSTFTILTSLEDITTGPPLTIVKTQEKALPQGSVSLSIAQPEQINTQSASLSLSIKR